jgi:hypothetical protein
MESAVDIPWVGVDIPRGRYIMGRGVDIPWAEGGRYSMGRVGSICHG